MEIHVALDGSRRRDLSFFQGDEVTLTLVAYAHDGDSTPIAVTNVRFVAPESGGFAYGSQFVVSDANVGRSYYRLVGEIAGVTTTLAHGYITVEGEHGWPFGFPADGYWISP